MPYRVGGSLSWRGRKFVVKTVVEEKEEEGDLNNNDNDDDEDNNNNNDKKDDQQNDYYDYIVQKVEEEEEEDNNEGDKDDDSEEVYNKTINKKDDDEATEQEKWYYKATFMLDWVNKISKMHYGHPGFAVSIDEKMKLFKDCSNTTHTMKKKPIKESFKFYAMVCAYSGYCFFFFPDGLKEKERNSRCSCVYGTPLPW